MIKTRCPSCGNRFKVDAAFLGKKGRCDRCSEVFEIAAAPPGKAPLGVIGLAVAGLAVIGGGLALLVSDETPGPEGPSDPQGRTTPQETPTGPKPTILPGQVGPEATPGGEGPEGRRGGEQSRGMREREGPLRRVEDRAIASWSPRVVGRVTDKSKLALGRAALIAGKSLALNGRELRLAVPEGGLALFLPQGRHWLVQAGKGQLIEVEESYFEHCQKELRRRLGDGDLQASQLFRQKISELEFPEEPYLLDWIGRFYLSRDDFAAAERSFVRALAMEPAYPPAHLGLAEVLAKTDRKEEAMEEARLAEDLDPVGAFAMERELATIRGRLGLKYLARPRVRLDPERYRWPIPKDDSVVRACLLLAELSAGPLDRAAAINNAGLRLRKLKRYEDSYRTFLAALRVLRPLEPTVRGRLTATTIYANLADLYVEARWPETEEIVAIKEIFPSQS